MPRSKLDEDEDEEQLQAQIDWRSVVRTAAQCFKGGFIYEAQRTPLYANELSYLIQTRYGVYACAEESLLFVPSATGCIQMVANVGDWIGDFTANDRYVVAMESDWKQQHVYEYDAQTCTHRLVGIVYEPAQVFLLEGARPQAVLVPASGPPRYCADVTAACASLSSSGYTSVAVHLDDAQASAYPSLVSGVRSWARSSRVLALGLQHDSTPTVVVLYQADSRSVPRAVVVDQRETDILCVAALDDAVIACEDSNVITCWNVPDGSLRWINESAVFGFGCVYATTWGLSMSDCRSTVTIRSLASGEIEETLEGPTDCVQSVCHTDLHTAVLGGSQDSTLRIWNAVSGREMHLIDLGAEVDAIRVIGSRIVALTKENLVVLEHTTAADVPECVLVSFDG